MKYILDTDICIGFIRKRNSRLVHKLTDLAGGDAGVSSITVAELEFGANKSERAEQNRQALYQFLIPLLIVEFDYQAAVLYGEIRANLERSGKPSGGFDLLIAAQALSLDVTLVTNNVKEFSRVPKLRIENWLKV